MVEEFVFGHEADWKLSDLMQTSPGTGRESIIFLCCKSTRFNVSERWQSIS
jgi:hypothetical protein